VAVTVSEPTGAFVEEHEAVPEASVALHIVVVPMLKTTEPAGVPPVEVTVAE
jgi:hypothetical protein